MSDEPLVASWRQRWNRNLFGFLGRRMPGAVDIRHLAQRTHERLLRARNLSEVQDPQAYLMRLAAQALRQWRAEQTHDPDVPQEDDSWANDPEADVEFEAAVTQQQLDLALSSFSPMIRAVVVLKLRDQRSLEQIAHDLDISIWQVRRYLVRGYQGLREAAEN